MAIDYYRDGDLYMFEAFQTAHAGNYRRPKIDNLYNVFVAICDDEMEPVKTMVARQKPAAENILAGPPTAPLPAAPLPTAPLTVKAPVEQKEAIA